MAAPPVPSLDGVDAGRPDHLRRVGVADDEGVGQARRAIQHGRARKARRVDPVAVFAADDSRAGDVGLVPPFCSNDT
ncbi:hypothetical protein G6F32_015531 [Rhizopus arrhizus]|nr:hypothetical protein G6F32_015531 [Rhizopus arrhizus]